MSKEADRILIFTEGVSDAPSPEVRRGLRESAERASVEASEVTVSVLQENLRGFLNHMDAVMGVSPKAVGGLAVDEVEIHVQIDGKGNVGLLGMAKAEVAARGGIRFVLRKPR